jgi:hypothetical protein
MENQNKFDFCCTKKSFLQKSEAFGHEEPNSSEMEKFSVRNVHSVPTLVHLDENNVDNELNRKEQYKHSTVRHDGDMKITQIVQTWLIIVVVLRLPTINSVPLLLCFIWVGHRRRSST